MKEAYKLKVTRIIYRGPEFQPEQEFMRIPIVEQHFDEKHRKIFECQFDNLGEPENIISWQYDDSDRLSIYTETDPGQEFSFREELHYRPDGKVEKKVIYYADGSADREVYHYSKEGQLIETRRITDDNEIEEINRWEYQGSHPVKEVTEIPGEGVTSEKTMKYSPDGVLIEKIEENEQGYSKTLYEYSPQGILIKTTVLDEDGGLVQEYEMLAWEGDKVLKAREKAGNGPEKWIETAYDEQGRLIREITTLGDGSLYSEIYRQYDIQGRLSMQQIITGTGYQSAPQYLRYEYIYEPLA
jgi:antitoxin component YwqK of YwqJK toxin-antitoxin module